ncbi:hypothetical protein LINPERPRIM_LOCUS2216 [Linum perenne]
MSTKKPTSSRTTWRTVVIPYLLVLISSTRMIRTWFIGAITTRSAPHVVV